MTDKSIKAFIDSINKRDELIYYSYFLIPASFLGYSIYSVYSIPDCVYSFCSFRALPFVMLSFVTVFGFLGWGSLLQKIGLIKFE